MAGRIVGRTVGRIAGILFDKDGTLLDFEATWKPINREVARVAAGGDEALARRLMALAGHCPESDVLTPGSPLVAGTAEDVARAWLPLLPGADLEPLTRLIDRVFTEAGAQSMAPVGDLPTTLGRLHRRGLRLGLATSDNAASAHMALQRFAVDHLFDFVCGWDSGHGGKPGPGMVQAFCRAAGLSPDRVAVVGDSVHDLEMGAAAGAGLRVAVLTGPGTHADLAAHADHVIDDIGRLEELLDQLATRGR